MIDWNLVAAYIGPLIAAIGLASVWFSRSNKKRDEHFQELINNVTSNLVLNQKLMQQQIDQMNLALAAQTDHLNKQDVQLTEQGHAIARIEGRLAGPISVIPTNAS